MGDAGVGTYLSREANSPRLMDLLLSGFSLVEVTTTIIGRISHFPRGCNGKTMPKCTLKEGFRS